jgi:hypothetical protein
LRSVVRKRDKLLSVIPWLTFLTVRRIHCDNRADTTEKSNARNIRLKRFRSTVRGTLNCACYAGSLYFRQSITDFHRERFRELSAQNHISVGFRGARSAPLTNASSQRKRD